MSVATTATTANGPGPLPGDEPPRDAGQHGPLPGEPMTFARQAATIREMLSTLETLTSAGQQHTMNKIVSFVARRARHALREAGPRSEDRLADLSRSLQHEAERPSPDAATFSRRTEDLLALLAAIV